MAEMSGYFFAEFHFDIFVHPEVKDLIIEAFNIMYAEAVDQINPMLETWNAAYTKDVKGEFDLEYNGYISDCYQPILDQVNSTFYESPVKLFMNRTEAVICGRFTEPITKARGSMFFTLRPIYK